MKTPRYEIRVIDDRGAAMWQIWDNALNVLRKRASYDTTRVTRQCAALNREDKKS